MICFIDRSTVEFDIRLNKYVQACKATDTPYLVIGWDRTLNARYIDEHEYQLKLFSPYGQYKNIWHMFIWSCYVWRKLATNFRRYKVIHAVNLLNTLLALPFMLLGKKVICDIYDSQVPWIEKRMIPLIDTLIVPHERRLEVIGISKDKVKRLFVVENVPALDYKLQPLKSRTDNKIHLSYVGTFQKKIRGIENLLDFVKNDSRMILDIAGTGDNLDSLVKQYAAECDRILYHGKLLYTEALELMHNSDFIVALYYLSAPIHKYATPNKFHESLFLSRPIITSKDTLVGERVSDGNTGYVVGDTIDELRNVFNDYGAASYSLKYAEKCNNCHNLWQKKYRNYRIERLHGEYVDMVQNLARES